MQYILLEGLGVWDIRTFKVGGLRGLVPVTCPLKSLHKGSGHVHLSNEQFTQNVLREGIAPNIQFKFVGLVTGTTFLMHINKYLKLWLSCKHVLIHYKVLNFYLLEKLRAHGNK